MRVSRQGQGDACCIDGERMDPGPPTMRQDGPGPGSGQQVAVEH